ncbi:MAG: hypothetical protein WCE68_08285 [Anaerolineales bacterium]
MSETLNLKTMTGLTVAEMYAKLDEELPPEAYKAIAGTHGKDGSELTDIDPNYATEVLNMVFGPCGLGWGYAYNPADMTLTIENRQKSNGTGTRRVSLAVLTKLSVWYKLIKPDGSDVLCQIDAGGASDNDDEAYAMKGAITYAIGNALSKIGWQKSVYLGQRSHKTVRAGKPKAAAPTLQAKQAAASPAAPAAKAAPAKPVLARPAAAPAPASAGDGEISEEPAAAAKPEAMTLETVLQFTVPTGAWKGKTIQDVVTAGESGQKAIEFWARMVPGTDLDKQTLKNTAMRYQELAKANHKVPAGDKVAQPA